MRPNSQAWLIMLFVGTAGTTQATSLEQELSIHNGASVRINKQAGMQIFSGLQIPVPGRTVTDKALKFVEQYRAYLLPKDTLSRWSVERVVHTPLGQVVQLQQQYLGVVLYGKGLSASFDKAGRLNAVVTTSQPILSQTQQIQDQLADRQQALDLATAALSQFGRLRAINKQQTVWLVQSKKLILAHLITLDSAVPFGTYTFLIISQPALIAYVYEQTNWAYGYAYPSNPVRDETYKEVELPYLTSPEHLSGEFVEVFNCAGSRESSCSAKEQRAQADADGNYYIEPTGDNDPARADDQFVEVQAYYGINTIHDYFVGLGANPAPLKVGVNYPMPDKTGPNAFYSGVDPSMGGPSIMMGQWREIDLALENDVIFHEYGHHVFGEFAQSNMFDMDDYGPVFWGLAINEATADYFSCSALEDPALGEYFASQLPLNFPNGYLRTVDNELSCPDGLFGEGHDDGMIWSGFLWDVRQLVGKEQLDPLYLDVIAQFPKEIDFSTATRVFLERAATVFDETTMEKIQQLASERGLIECERFIQITQTGHQGFVYGRQTVSNIMKFVPAELHYYIDIPKEAKRLEINLSSASSVQDAEVVLLVRKDQPVEHRFGWTGLKSTFDFTLEEFGQIDLSETQVQFEAGHRYYFHPINRGSATTVYTISGGVDEDTSQDGGTLDPDAGTTEPDAGTTEPDAGTTEPDAGTTEPDSGSDPTDSSDPVECPEGQTEMSYNSETICVPICEEGFTLQRIEDEWVCTQKAESSGCGCSKTNAPTSPLAWFGLLFCLAWRTRARHNRSHSASS